MYSISSSMVKAAESPLRRLLPSPFEQLNAILGGGFPIGQVVEISGAASSGKATVAFSACMQVLQQGKAAAWIDPRAGFWPLTALEAGLPLDKLLVLRVADSLAALRAAQLLLSCSGAVGALVVDLPVGARPNDVQLMKLQRFAERSGTLLLLLTERAPEAGSLAPVVALRLCVRRATPVKEFPLGLELEVLRHKSGPIRRAVEESIHGPDRVRISSSL